MDADGGVRVGPTRTSSDGTKPREGLRSTTPVNPAGSAAPTEPRGRIGPSVRPFTRGTAEASRAGTRTSGDAGRAPWRLTADPLCASAAAPASSRLTRTTRVPALTPEAGRVPCPALIILRDDAPAGVDPGRAVRPVAPASRPRMLLRSSPCRVTDPPEAVPDLVARRGAAVDWADGTDRVARDDAAGGTPALRAGLRGAAGVREALCVEPDRGDLLGAACRVRPDEDADPDPLLRLAGSPARALAAIARIAAKASTSPAPSHPARKEYSFNSRHDMASPPVSYSRRPLRTPFASQMFHHVNSITRSGWLQADSPDSARDIGLRRRCRDHRDPRGVPLSPRERGRGEGSGGNDARLRHALLPPDAGNAEHVPPDWRPGLAATCTEGRLGGSCREEPGQLQRSRR